MIAVIGSIDSSGGAGINQDIRVAAAMGFRIQTCVGSLTIQTTRGVEAIHPTPLEVFSNTLAAILALPQLQYIKIGALGSIDQIDLLVRIFTRPREYFLVLDPVIQPSQGIPFLDEESIVSLRKLASISDYVCPNLPELLALADTDDPDPASVARDFSICTGAKLLVTGGHADGAMVVDSFYDAKSVHACSHPRRDWKYSHGTGCAFSMAFTCLISQGLPELEAFRAASQWVFDYYNHLNENSHTSSERSRFIKPRTV